MRELTDITLVLDSSGSMASIAGATIEGVNAFIAAQKKIDLPAVFTMHSFSTPQAFLSISGFSENVYKDPRIILMPRQDLKNVGPLSFFNPVGGTALLDAMGFTIDEVGARLAAMAAPERPSKVLIVTMTDGGENSSKAYSRDKIQSMVKLQSEVYKWEFLYIGANQDAFKVGAGLGIVSANCLNYAHSKSGTEAAFATLASSTVEYRSGGSVALKP